MKFYMAPGSCTTGIHILLEELELVFEANIISLPAGDNLKEEYLSINPKGTIPTLLTDDGTSLTEYVSIAYWLAKAYPRARLLPEELTQQAQILAMTSYIVNTVHGQGFARLFIPEQFESASSRREETEAQGKAIIEKSFALIADQFDSQSPYVFGEYSIADPTLFYVSFWADKLKLPLPDACLRHYDKMLSRPVVRQVLAEEGYRV